MSKSFRYISKKDVLCSTQRASPYFNLMTIIEATHRCSACFAETRRGYLQVFMAGTENGEAAEIWSQKERIREPMSKDLFLHLSEDPFILVIGTV